MVGSRLVRGGKRVKFAFGDCVLDGDRRELYRAGAPVPLTPKAYDFLELLVRERPRALSKAEIRDRLWPATFVADVTLTTLAFEVRTAIGDDARSPRHLRTVRKFGYAFSEGVPAAPPANGQAAVCRLLADDREFPLSEGDHIIGRAGEADLVLDLPRVSRRHARISVSGASAVIEDLGSKNGTLVGDRAIEGPRLLSDFDVIRIGTVRLTFRCSSRAASTETGA
jgi:DNA-binding winged helix-turn-helix (wHTH) protein